MGVPATRPAARGPPHLPGGQAGSLERPTEFGPPFTKAIIPLQKSYAASWTPGKFVWVDSGHDIHYEKPAVVGDAVRWVVVGAAMCRIPDIYSIGSLVAASIR